MDKFNYELSDRERRIILQAITNYEYEIKKSVLIKQLSNDEENAIRYEAFLNEVHAIVEKFEVR